MTSLHEMLALLAKGYGLFLFIGLFVAVVAYAYWPSNREKFRKAARSILDKGGEDRPG